MIRSSYLCLFLESSHTIHRSHQTYTQLCWIGVELRSKSTRLLCKNGRFGREFRTVTSAEAYIPQHTKPGFHKDISKTESKASDQNSLSRFSRHSSPVSQICSVLRNRSHTVNSSDDEGENLENLDWSVVRTSMRPAKKNPTPVKTSGCSSA